MAMEVLTVDKVSGGIATLSRAGTTVDVPVSKLPPDTKSGDVLAFDGSRYYYDEGLTANRVKLASDKKESLFS